MLTRIRNGIIARHAEVEMPLSKVKVEVARLLKEEGYITDYTVERENAPRLKIQLKYTEDKQSVVTGIKRVSRPGLRNYVGYQKIPMVLAGMGTVIISTPKGMMTGKQARRERAGGEVVCYVW